MEPLNLMVTLNLVADDVRHEVTGRGGVSSRPEAATKRRAWSALWRKVVSRKPVAEGPAAADHCEQVRSVPVSQRDVHPSRSVPVGQGDVHPSRSVPAGQGDVHPSRSVPVGQRDVHPSRVTVLR